MFFTRRAGSKFTNRQDPATSDFNQGTLTHDAAWHEMDLSSIIPAGTKLVMLRVQLIAVPTIGVMKVRRNGNTNDVNTDVASMETVGFPELRTLWVVPDADGKVEYWFTDVTWIAIAVSVAGWFK